MTVTNLFDPLTLRALTIPNRAWVSPMCQYSATDGMPDDWHLVHLGQFATGRAGLVLTEATAVTPDARISPQDTGIWSDAHTCAWRRVTDFVHAQGRPVGMQLAHAGRKASTYAPWLGHGSVPPAEGGWSAVSSTDRPFGRYAAPRRLSVGELHAITADFAAAARRARTAGFDTVELHYAHGYLGHQLCSPLANDRDDDYGGDFAGRTRWLVETAQAVREVWPDDLPVLARITGSDWVEGGWAPADAVRLATALGNAGIDLVDVSSGGVLPDAPIAVGPAYQLPFARDVRHGSGLPTGAVGMITDAAQAQQIVASGDADVVLLARALLRNPHWPLQAAAELGQDIDELPQYERAAFRGVGVAAGPR